MFSSLEHCLSIILFSIILLYCECLKQDSPIHLYATKTAYHQAYHKLLNNDNQIKTFKTPDQCKPVMLYMICRHATRYPSKKKITKIQEKIYFFRDQLISNNKLRPDHIERFRNWKLRMQIDDDNRITDTGFLETRELARRIKTDYPVFFDPNKANVKLYTTYKSRTNETAFAFFDEIYKNQTFRPTIKKHLVFHRECNKRLLDNGIKLKNPKAVDDLIASNAVTVMRAKLAEKIGIDLDELDFKSLKMIYITCSFEYAIFNDTLWCELFSKEDFQILEYIIDLQSYLVAGHGRRINGQMACPILVDIIDHFNESIKEKKLTTSLQFSHSGIFKRIYTMFGLFKQFGSSHCRSSLNCFNEWRSSLILPFLANIKFLLYDCSPKSVRNSNSSSSIEDFRFTVKIQEHFVKIDGCDSLLCPLNDFMTRYRREAEQCDLDEICKI